MNGLDKDSLLELNDNMRATIVGLNCDDPLELCVFASSMIKMGCYINMQIVKQLNKQE